MKVKCFLLLISLLSYPNYALACTSFYLHHGTQAVHGANYDWHRGDGYILINKRGIAKKALSDPKKRLNPASWTSRFGSVSFNTYGCDWPWGGMNEAGLSCSTLLLDETTYPTPDARPSIFVGQWLQYQLDNYATIQEVCSSHTELRIRKTDSRLRAHYFFSDRQGNCAVVEFINGKQVAYHAQSMPIKVLTNDRYDLSLSATKKFRGFGGRLPIPTGNISYMRFIRTADRLMKDQPKPIIAIVDRAFAILDSAAYKQHRTIHTQWQIVFDLNNQRIWYRTQHQSEVKAINLNSLNFSCESPVMMHKIDNPVHPLTAEGFAPITYEANRTMVERAFKINPMNPNLSEERLNRVAKYSETFFCK